MICTKVSEWTELVFGTDATVSLCYRYYVITGFEISPEMWVLPS